MIHRIQHEIRRSFLSGNCRRVFSSSHSSPSTTGGTARKRLFQEELNIIYDSKCNICKLEMDFLARRDAKISSPSAPRKLRLTDIEGDDYDPDEPANGGVSYESGMSAIHAVAADGRVVVGVPVFSRAYDLVGLGWLFAFTEWRIMKPAVQWGYEMFAKYRTNITRGSSLKDLIQAHYDERSLKKVDGQEKECNRCDNIKR